MISRKASKEKELKHEIGEVTRVRVTFVKSLKKWNVQKTRIISYSTKHNRSLLNIITKHVLYTRVTYIITGKTTRDNKLDI